MACRKRGSGHDAYNDGFGTASTKNFDFDYR
jgi:hypothetical protein